MIIRNVLFVIHCCYLLPQNLFWKRTHQPPSSTTVHRHLLYLPASMLTPNALFNQLHHKAPYTLYQPSTLPIHYAQSINHKGPFTHVAQRSTNQKALFTHTTSMMIRILHLAHSHRLTHHQHHPQMSPYSLIIKLTKKILTNSSLSITILRPVQN